MDHNKMCKMATTLRATLRANDVKTLEQACIAAKVIVTLGKIGEDDKIEFSQFQSLMTMFLVVISEYFEEVKE